MPFLVFIAILVAGAFWVLLIGMWMGRRRRGPITPIVRIMTGHETEIGLARSTLKAAGIWNQMRNVDDTAYAMPRYELVIREADAESAREALGLD